MYLVDARGKQRHSAENRPYFDILPLLKKEKKGKIALFNLIFLVVALALRPFCLRDFLFEVANRFFFAFKLGFAP